MNTCTWGVMVATFADWLSERLERRGLSIRQFAMQVGVSPEGAGYWVSGHRKPRASHLAAIAAALGATESEVTRVWTDYKTDEEYTGQTVILKPGVVAHMYSPSGERIELTPRLLRILTAAAEPDEELAAVDAETEAGEI